MKMQEGREAGRREEGWLVQDSLQVLTCRPSLRLRCDRPAVLVSNVSPNTHLGSRPPPASSSYSLGLHTRRGLQANRPGIGLQATQGGGIYSWLLHLYYASLLHLSICPFVINCFGKWKGGKGRGAGEGHWRARGATAASWLFCPPCPPVVQGKHVSVHMTVGCGQLTPCTRHC